MMAYRNNAADNPVLLILDNHISRYSSELLELAKENQVVMLTVPPHTTHKLQPLDRSVMHPLKAFYNRNLQLLGPSTNARRFPSTMYPSFAERRIPKH